MKNKKLIDRVKSPAKQKGGFLKAILFGVGAFIAFGLIFSLISRFASPERYTAVGTIRQADAYIESSGGAYLGELEGTVYAGNGTFQYLAGGTYEGSFDKSQRSGDGTFTWDNGDSFTGSWEADAMKEGVYSFADGRIYEGTFSDGKLTEGTFTLGPAQMDLPDTDDDIVKYVATVENGLVSKVDFQMTTGYSYVGALTGEAEVKYPSGNTYSGQMSEGIRSGLGTFTWYEDGSKAASYEGAWQNGTMHGSGTYRYTSSTYPNLTGTFSEGRPKGILVYYKESGNTFDTTWENGNCTNVKET